MRMHPSTVVLALASLLALAISAEACAIGSEARHKEAAAQAATPAAAADAASPSANGPVDDTAPPAGNEEGKAPPSASSPRPGSLPPPAAIPDAAAPRDASTPPIFPPGLFDAGVIDGGKGTVSDGGRA